MTWSRCLVLSALVFSFTPAAFAAGHFDHHYSQWGQFLARHLHEGRLDYEGIIRRDAQTFRAIVVGIEEVPEDEYSLWSRDQRMAFWINAYNIAAISLIVEHYPLKRSAGLPALRYPPNSIQQIPDVWNKPILTLIGKQVSLNDIENEILRKEFQDPRIHFAIVCASLGCPVLRGEPYVFDRLDRQLDEAVSVFLADRRKFDYDAPANTFYLSPIFKWFEQDFRKEGGSIAFIRKYAPPAPDLPAEGRIRWLDYDWSLNEDK